MIVNLKYSNKPSLIFVVNGYNGMFMIILNTSSENGSYTLQKNNSDTILGLGKVTVSQMHQSILRVTKLYISVSGDSNIKHSHFWNHQYFWYWDNTQVNISNKVEIYILWDGRSVRNIWRERKSDWWKKKWNFRRDSINKEIIVEESHKNIIEILFEGREVVD